MYCNFNILHKYKNTCVLRILRIFGSSVLSGLMLDLGLVKIIWGGVLPFFSPVLPYPIPVPNPAGQNYLLLNLTCPKMSINFIIFNNRYKQHFITESAQIPIALLLRFILNHTNTFYATLIKIDVLRNLYFVWLKIVKLLFVA